ncbi:hypothetical protein [Methylobacterium iners]|uniref:hypothetical protein n=1 Tax=Methylobacterium iners TaxID=418707 RepID=UPI001EE340A0|nr:hypothetical protein [Methylobacterium iners]
MRPALARPVQVAGELAANLQHQGVDEAAEPGPLQRLGEAAQRQRVLGRAVQEALVLSRRARLDLLTEIQGDALALRRLARHVADDAAAQGQPLRAGAKLDRKGAAELARGVQGVLQPGLVLGVGRRQEGRQRHAPRALVRIDAEPGGKGRVEHEAIGPEIVAPGPDHARGGESRGEVVGVEGRRPEQGPRHGFP